MAGAVLLALTFVLVRRVLNDETLTSTTMIIGDPGELPPQLQDDVLVTLDAERRQYRTAALNALLSYGALALGAVGLVAAGFGWIVAGRVLRPLHRIAETATRIGRAGGAGLHERIALAGPRDEITELADTFDEMIERLDHSFDGQRRFVANASHELRTPLAINRALLEVATSRPGSSADVRQLGDTLLAVNARHERLIDGLLMLARSEHELLQNVPVDLADLVEYVADELDTGAVTLRLDTMPALLAGDPMLLEQLVANLLGNGVRHNIAEGGWVRASTGHNLAGEIELVVSNTGPVVPAYDVGAIFEPFRQLAGRTANGGAGLGLSIVRAVAQAHGGRVSAQPREGGGLVVLVTLPPPAFTGTGA